MSTFFSSFFFSQADICVQFLGGKRGGEAAVIFKDKRSIALASFHTTVQEGAGMWRQQRGEETISLVAQVEAAAFLLAKLPLFSPPDLISRVFGAPRFLLGTRCVTGPLFFLAYDSHQRVSKNSQLYFCDLYILFGYGRARAVLHSSCQYLPAHLSAFCFVFSLNRKAMLHFHMYS